MTRIQIETDRISDWDTFHDIFAETFGFPTFYGRNMDAWIDCMSYLVSIRKHNLLNLLSNGAKSA